MALTVPAACESQLTGRAESARLAIIIDLLSQQLGGDLTGDSYGVGGVPVTSADASAADLALTDAPGAAAHIYADYVDLSVGATALAVTFKEETSGTVIAGPIYMAANSSFRVPIRRTLPGAVNKKLVLRTSAAGNISALAAWRAV